MTKPPSLTSQFVHLGLGATALTQPDFSGMEWYEGYGARWTSWEMHPSGHEVVVCTAGEITLIQEIDGAEVSVTLQVGEYAINEPGVWHTADVSDTATALFITAGLGTEHRAR